MQAQAPISGPQVRCSCFTPPLHHQQYDAHKLGVDPTNGRYGEVTVETCQYCGSKWLHYQVEVEGITQSGKWYRGMVAEDELNTLTPETALGKVESLAWYMYGGSYFNSEGEIGSGKIPL